MFLIQIDRQIAFRIEKPKFMLSIDSETGKWMFKPLIEPQFKGKEELKKSIQGKVF